jgi:hypothetical protein
MLLDQYTAFVAKAMDVFRRSAEGMNLVERICFSVHCPKCFVFYGSRLRRNLIRGERVLLSMDRIQVEEASVAKLISAIYHQSALPDERGDSFADLLEREHYARIGELN